MIVKDKPKTNDSFPYVCSNLLLGKGGSGAVFLAKSTRCDSFFAIKRCYSKIDNSFSAPPLESHRHDAPPASQAQSTPILPPCTQNKIKQYHEDCKKGEIVSANKLIAYPSHLPVPDMGLPASGSLFIQKRTPFPTLVGEWQLLEHIGAHPHIIHYLGSYTSSRNVTYFAMELMNSDVSRELRRKNAHIMKEASCAVIAYGILEALSYIHEKGIAHRDIKPGNILLKPGTADDVKVSTVVCADGESETELTNNPSSLVKASLGDFSAAHFNHITDPQYVAVRGTLYYKSPEQLLGKPIKNYTACDLWAFGCTLFEIVTGAPAFPGESELKVLLNMFHTLGSSFDEYPLQAKRGLLYEQVSMSPELEDLLRHLLVFEPTERFTAREAMQHPFFDHVRRKIEQDAGSKEADKVQLLFPLRLVYARSPGEREQELAFRPVAATPLKRHRDVLDEEKGLAMEFICGGNGNNVSSFVSEEASIHWSLVGANNSCISQHPAQQGTPRATASSTAVLFPHVGPSSALGSGFSTLARLPAVPRPGGSHTPCNRSASRNSNSITRALNLNDTSTVMADISTSLRSGSAAPAASSPAKTVLAPPLPHPHPHPQQGGGGGSSGHRPPVLRVAGGTSLTVSNMRTSHAYEQTAHSAVTWQAHTPTATRPEACGFRTTAAFAATTGARAQEDSQAPPTSRRHSTGETDTRAPHLAAPSPPDTTVNKALHFDSPVPLAQSYSDPASFIEPMHTPSRLSDEEGIRSCCSTGSASPVLYRCPRYLHLAAALSPSPNAVPRPIPLSVAASSKLYPMRTPPCFTFPVEPTAAVPTAAAPFQELDANQQPTEATMTPTKAHGLLWGTVRPAPATPPHSATMTPRPGICAMVAQRHCTPSLEPPPSFPSTASPSMARTLQGGGGEWAPGETVSAEGMGGQEASRRRVELASSSA